MSTVNALPATEQAPLSKDNIGNRKIFVLDTNVLIHNPESLFVFEDNVVVIPIIVIEEIDNFKKYADEKGRNARQIGRYLDKLRTEGSIKDGVALDNKGYILVSVNEDIDAILSKYRLLKRNDNYIIGTAIHYKDKYPKSRVVLVSKDANVRIKADALGIKSENFEKDTIIFEEMYSGVTELTVSQAEWLAFRDRQYLQLHNSGLYPNQFVKLYADPEHKGECLEGRYSGENEVIYPLTKYSYGQEVFGIKSRNEEQMFAFDLLLDPAVQMVSLAGKAGTGKTLLALAAGLHQVIDKDLYNRLVVSRPMSPLGKDIGFLPGSKTDKFNPWMQPIYDNMQILFAQKQGNENYGNKKTSNKASKLNDYIDFGLVELEPLTYIRGRSLPNQYIIIDEAQNLTPHEMKTIITRAGENTKIVFTGDPYQIDIPYLDSRSNGLSTSAEKLKPENLVGHITLQKGERSQLADIAAKYF